METIQQLMVAMTFSDGNASVSPKCGHKERGLRNSAKRYKKQGQFPGQFPQEMVMVCTL
jgi:hypothetical protein